MTISDAQEAQTAVSQAVTVLKESAPDFTYWACCLSGLSHFFVFYLHTLLV